MGVTPSEARNPSGHGEPIITALLSLNETEEGLADLRAVYGWSGLEAVEDGFYDDLRQKLEVAGVSIDSLGK